MTEVWPVLTWNAHGEGTMLLGVYDSREAAFEALKAEPNMTAYVDAEGALRGRPKHEPSFGELLARPYIPVKWALGRPFKVQSRAPAAGTTPAGTVVP